MSQTWRAAQTGLKASLSPHVYKNWIEPIQGIEADGQLRLVVPTEFHAQWVQDNYSHLLREALQMEFQFEVQSSPQFDDAFVAVGQPVLRVIEGGKTLAVPGAETPPLDMTASASAPAFSPDELEKWDLPEVSITLPAPPVTVPEVSKTQPSFAQEAMQENAAAAKSDVIPAGLPAGSPQVQAAALAQSGAHSQMTAIAQAEAAVQPDLYPSAPAIEEPKPATTVSADHLNLHEPMPFIDWLGTRITSQSLRLFLESSERLPFNPLFIRSEPGMGKTALVRNHIRAFQQRQPQKRIAYISVPQFTQDMVRAIEKREVQKLHQQYQTQYDVLVVDEIQFLEGKKKTQTELLHLIKYFIMHRRPVIMLSQKWARDLDIDDSVRRTMHEGLTLEIGALDCSSQGQIFRSLAKAERLCPPEHLVRYLENHQLNAVCDVTSLWTRLRVHVVFNRNWPTAEEWVDWVRPFEKTCYRTSIDGKRVVERVCDVFKVSMEDLQGPSRKRTVADARRVLVLFLRELALMSFQEIGTLLDRHHSTIMHLLEGTAERTQTDALFARQLEFIREGLKK